MAESFGIVVNVDNLNKSDEGHGQYAHHTH